MRSQHTARRGGDEVRGEQGEVRGVGEVQEGREAAAGQVGGQGVGRAEGGGGVPAGGHDHVAHHPPPHHLPHHPRRLGGPEPGGQVRPPLTHHPEGVHSRALLMIPQPVGWVGLG